MRFFHLFLYSFSALFFIACQDNTSTPITKSVTSVKIDQGDISIHSTDDMTSLSATVFFSDNSSDIATESVVWNNSDYNVTYLLGGDVWASANGGESNISISYAEFNDYITVSVHKLVSFEIYADDVNTTGTHVFEAKGNFENGDENISIVKNIAWSATNNAVVSISNGITNIELKSGETNVTATLFYNTVYEMNTTKSYTIE